jgi:flagellin
MLQRMRELSVQSANDTNSVSDRANLQLEIDQLLEEVNRIAKSSSWAGHSLLNGTSSDLAKTHGDTANFTFQIGAGTNPGDSTNIKIGATSTAALGLTDADVAPTDTSNLDDPGRISIDGNTIVIAGNLVNGDKYEFDLDGQEVDVVYSTTNQYTNDKFGLANQLKDDIDALVAAGTIAPDVAATVNADGDLVITKTTAPTVTAVSTTDGGGNDTQTLAYSGNTLTVGGTHEAKDVYKLTINGTAITYTSAANDGYMVSKAGAAAGIKAQIEKTAGLDDISVVDNGDGTLSFTQTGAPTLSAAEAVLNNQQETTLTYDDTKLLTVGGAWKDGKEISFKLFGKEIKVTTSSDDGFEDSKAGIANQIASAINDANISGITAVRTANANTVTITGKVVAEEGKVVNGSQYIRTSEGAQATGTVSISSKTGSDAAATYTAGDAYTFKVAGEDFTLVVGTDGYANDKYGVAQQMKDMIDARNIGGITVAVSTGTTAAVNITNVLTGTVTSTGHSTVVTDVLVRDVAAAKAADAGGADIAVTTAAKSFDAITRIDKALETLNTQRASLGAVSNRLESTISNLTNIVTNTSSAQSRIQDADFASESTALARAQILQQASMAMLAQANASKQSVLALLQG